MVTACQADNSEADDIRSNERMQTNSRNKINTNDNEFYQIRSSKLSSLLSNASVVPVDYNGDVAGPFREKFSENKTWNMVVDSKRVSYYSGNWYIKNNYVIIDKIIKHDSGLSVPMATEMKRKIYKDKFNEYYMTVPIISKKDDLIHVKISE